METFEAQGVGTHYAFMVGVNAIRREVIGMEDRAPTPEELQQMKSLVREAMEMGAVGLSSGLMYLPGRYASTEEVVELAKIAAEFDGLYDSHIRNPTILTYAIRSRTSKDPFGNASRSASARAHAPIRHTIKRWVPEIGGRSKQ
jgi:N-acyl-D-aspartate/D-glutamate deacylase